MEIAAKMSSKGQITVPEAVRDALGIGEGDNVVSGWRAIGPSSLALRTSCPWRERSRFRQPDATLHGMTRTLTAQHCCSGSLREVAGPGRVRSGTLGRGHSL